MKNVHSTHFSSPLESMEPANLLTSVILSPHGSWLSKGSGSQAPSPPIVLQPDKGCGWRSTSSRYYTPKTYRRRFFEWTNLAGSELSDLLKPLNLPRKPLCHGFNHPSHGVTTLTVREFSNLWRPAPYVRRRGFRELLVAIDTQVKHWEEFLIVTSRWAKNKFTKNRQHEVASLKTRAVKTRKKQPNLEERPLLS